jgi:hypothetical protein
LEHRDALTCSPDPTGDAAMATWQTFITFEPVARANNQHLTRGTGPHCRYFERREWREKVLAKKSGIIAGHERRSEAGDLSQVRFHIDRGGVGSVPLQCVLLYFSCRKVSGSED